MSDVVAQDRHPQDVAPVPILRLVAGYVTIYRIIQVVGIRNHVKNSARQVHHAQAMLESLVSRSRIEHVLHRQLMDVSQALDRLRIQDAPLVGVQLYEYVDGVPYLVIGSYRQIVPPL